MRERQMVKKGDNTYEQREKIERIPQTDCACMIHVQCKAINFTLGEGINRFKFTHCIEVISHMFNSTYSPS